MTRVNQCRGSCPRVWLPLSCLTCILEADYRKPHPAFPGHNIKESVSSKSIDKVLFSHSLYRCPLTYDDLDLFREEQAAQPVVKGGKWIDHACSSLLQSTPLQLRLCVCSACPRRTREDDRGSPKPFHHSAQCDTKQVALLPLAFDTPTMLTVVLKLFQES